MRLRDVFTVGSLFSGIGLLDYGLHLAGVRHAWFCERDEWRRGILARRWPGVRILDDVRHVGHGLPTVDGIVGGFPCKGASTAGKREGFGHPETVLWREMARAIRELRPRFVVVENVANILGLHDGAVWGEVLGDLVALGYSVVWDCLPAAAVGAPHLRDRVFAVASNPDIVAGTSPIPRRGAGGALAQPGAIERTVGSDRDARAASHSDEPGRLERGRSLAGKAQLPATERTGASAADARCERGELRRGSAGMAAGPGGHPGGETPQRQRPWNTAGDSSQTAAHSSRDAERGAGPPAGSERERARTRAVEWGEYEPAIRRWEHVHGAVPDPLVERVRGVDARSAARLERSRLSALGDGVQVQVGYLVGAYLMEMAA
jgi:site-specific DNA-cytosine methylase